MSNINPNGSDHAVTSSKDSTSTTDGAPKSNTNSSESESGATSAQQGSQGQGQILLQSENSPKVIPPRSSSPVIVNNKDKEKDNNSDNGSALPLLDLETSKPKNNNSNPNTRQNYNNQNNQNNNNNQNNKGPHHRLSSSSSFPSLAADNNNGVDLNDLMYNTNRNEMYNYNSGDESSTNGANNYRDMEIDLDSEGEVNILSDGSDREMFLSQNLNFNNYNNNKPYNNYSNYKPKNNNNTFRNNNNNYKGNYMYNQAPYQESYNSFNPNNNFNINYGLPASNNNISALGVPLVNRNDLLTIRGDRLWIMISSLLTLSFLLARDASLISFCFYILLINLLTFLIIKLGAPCTISILFESSSTNPTFGGSANPSSIGIPSNYSSSRPSLSKYNSLIGSFENNNNSNISKDNNSNSLNLNNSRDSPFENKVKRSSPLISSQNNINLNQNDNNNITNKNDKKEVVSEEKEGLNNLSLSEVPSPSGSDEIFPSESNSSLSSLLSSSPAELPVVPVPVPSSPVDHVVKSSNSFPPNTRLPILSTGCPLPITLSESDNMPPGVTYACDTDYKTFKIRDLGYKTTNKKVHSASPQYYHLVGLDMFNSEKKIKNLHHHIAIPEFFYKTENKNNSDGSIFGSTVSNGDPLFDPVTNVPEMFIVNFQVPSYPPNNPLWGSKSVEDGPGWSVVFYFKLNDEARNELEKETTAASRLWKNFVQDCFNEKTTNRMKCLPRIENLTQLNLPYILTGFMAKSNNKPFLVRPQHEYYKGPGWLLMDVDVHRFGYTPNLAVNKFLAFAPKIIFDVGFVIEGYTDDELPEQVLTTIKCAHLDVGVTKPLQYWKDLLQQQGKLV